jgi:hypothetical protein
VQLQKGQSKKEAKDIEMTEEMDESIQDKFTLKQLA